MTGFMQMRTVWKSICRFVFWGTGLSLHKRVLVDLYTTHVKLICRDWHLCLLCPNLENRKMVRNWIDDGLLQIGFWINVRCTIRMRHTHDMTWEVVVGMVQSRKVAKSMLKLKSLHFQSMEWFYQENADKNRSSTWKSIFWANKVPWIKIAVRDISSSGNFTHKRIEFGE